MILHFININRRVSAGILFVLMSIFFSCKVFSDKKHVFNLPDKSGYIFWKCESDLCTIYLKKKVANKVILLEKISSPSVAALSKHLVKLFFSCGSPCNYTMFYNSNMGLSKAFEFAVAVDAKRAVVVLAENNELVAYKIFDNTKKSLFSVKRDWSPTVTLFSDIIEAKFVDDALYVKYLEGKNYNEKIEIIHILN